jgi:hypothetical protein
MQIVSSIFLDFDNIHSCLTRYKAHAPHAAKAFAESPAYWLEALSGMRGDENEEVAHNFVLRRCYMNPKAYAPFRPYFVRDGWEVIDTPPLTEGGKTSADMHMAIDILDSIQHFPHITEYVIMAADADFTPIVIRLRKHLKRTVVYSSVNTAPAYRAACDSIIDEKQFAEIFEERHQRQQEPIQLPEKKGGKTFNLSDVGVAVLELLQGDEIVALPKVANLLMTRFGKEISENWAGYGSLKKLMREIPSLEIEQTINAMVVRRRRVPEEGPPKIAAGNGASKPALR